MAGKKARPPSRTKAKTKSAPRAKAPAKRNPKAKAKTLPTRKAGADRKAKAPRMTPAEYAWASFDTMLLEDADGHRDGEEGRVYLHHGRPFAVLTRGGTEIVLDFVAPKSMDTFANVKRF